MPITIVIMDRRKVLRIKFALDGAKSRDDGAKLHKLVEFVRICKCHSYLRIFTCEKLTKNLKISNTITY